MKENKGAGLKHFLNKESTAGFIFSLPFTIGFLLFMVVPMGISFYYSLCDYNILSPPVFAGLKNYIKMFTDDKVFFQTIGLRFILPLYLFLSV